MPIGPDGKVVVSFSRQVAPLIVERCSGCHIRQARGEFSAATHQSLMEGPPDGPVIIAGKPEESRLVELVESGAMPAQGARLTDEQVGLIRTWIEQGATVDGGTPQTPLAELIPDSAETEAPALTARAPTGNETISFSRDVAGVLVEACAGCHFESRNPRGGLNFTTFDGLLRGGDSGNIIEPGRGADSVLVQRLRGTGDGARMPQGRDPLADDVIAAIEKWIAEGAAFDGQSSSANLRDVARVAASEAASHEELAATRRQQSIDAWNLALPDTQPNQLETLNFFVIGGVSSSYLKAYSQAAEELARDMAKQLKLDGNEPLVKGRITLYVFARRYDYAEFGEMIESRTLPNDWRSHWRFDSVSAHVAALVTPEDDAEQAIDRASLARHLAATTISAMGPDVPRWFADGWGYHIASRIARREPAVRQWPDQAAAALRGVPSADALLGGSLPDDQAGLVGFALVAALGENSRGLDKLIAELRKGSPFEEAFATAFEQSLQEMLAGALGTNDAGAVRRPGKRR
jgi:mono/diheme cytochrome c family protein